LSFSHQKNLTKMSKNPYIKIRPKPSKSFKILQNSKTHPFIFSKIPPNPLIAKSMPI